MKYSFNILVAAFILIASFASATEESINLTSLRRSLATKYPTKPTTSKPTAVPTVAPTDAPTYKNNVDPTRYNIELVFSDTTDEVFKPAFINAKNRWESIIKNDIPNKYVYKKGTKCYDDFTKLKQDKIVDDLLIFATVTYIDGPGQILGGAGPCVKTKSPKIFSRVGIMQFDSSDMGEMLRSGLIEAVILHEMGHVLGIGTLWNKYKLINRPNKHQIDAYYNGKGGIEGQTAIGGQGKPVVETDGGKGTAYGHWNEETYETELMTGWLDPESKLSKLTVLALKDLGFVVDETKADAFTIPTGLRGNRKQGGIRMGDDILHGPIADGEVEPYDSE